MVANPLVNQVPVMIGGDGREEVYEFYAQYFLHQIPPDMEMVPVSRTIGQGRLVDEMVARFTHTIPMDFMLPGIPPTGKRVEVALVVVVQFDGDKMAHEHLYWDQASVLVQLGLLSPGDLPVVGAKGARSVPLEGQPINRKRSQKVSNMLEQRLAEISRRKLLLGSAGMMAAVAFPGSTAVQTVGSPHQPANHL
jgi:carboxymethylenebutenolidase